MIIGVLAGVTELTTCLQTTGQPIQHRVARMILSTRRALKRNFEQVTGGPDPDYPGLQEMERDHENQAVGKNDIVKEMGKLGHIFATKLEDSFDVWFAPLWSTTILWSSLTQRHQHLSPIGHEKGWRIFVT